MKKKYDLQICWYVLDNSPCMHPLKVLFSNSLLTSIFKIKFWKSHFGFEKLSKNFNKKKNIRKYENHDEQIRQNKHKKELNDVGYIWI